MTNQELNIKIARLAFPEFKVSNIANANGSIPLLEVYKDGSSSCKKVFNCNNWNDLMPLILKHNIRFTPYSKKHWTIEDDTIGGFYREGVHVDNLQRILSECLLKVLESGK